MKKFFRSFLVFIAVFYVQSGFSQMIIPKFYTPQKVEELSSDAEESMPLPFNQGKSLYFYRTYVEGEGRKTVVTGQDIWFSRLGKKGWAKPYRLFRSDYLTGDNSIVGTSADGKRVYLLNTTYHTADSSTRKLTFIDQLKKDQWTSPQEIHIPNFSFEDKYYSFYINPAESILLVSMSPTTQLLDEDLYVSLKDKEGNWGELIDLGKEINSRRFEVSPYISNDGKTLYFASNGHGGYGESDIFVSYRLDDSWTKWTKPLNLGEPINSSDYDAFFIMGNNKEVYFTSNRGSDHINIFKSIATGEFSFANIDSIDGQFFYKGLPGDQITLRIEDGEGNIIDEIVTDAYGHFQYVKLNGEENYLIKLANEDNSDFVGSKVYFVDENGEKTKRYVLTEDGIFVNSKDIIGEENIRGVFNYQQLPFSNIKLAILDENGFPLDTIVTDENGNFSYSLLRYEGAIKIVPLSLEEDQWADLTLYIVDEVGNKVKELKFDNKGFILPSDKEKGAALVKVQKGNLKVGKDKETISGAEIEIEAWRGMAEEKRVIYFGLNKTKLTEAEKSKLSLLLGILNYDTSRKLLLTGHTDNTGNNEINKFVGQKRAESVQAYFVKKGINKNRIIISSLGETTPQSSNDSEEGRAKNRRVMLEIK